MTLNKIILIGLLLICCIQVLSTKKSHKNNGKHKSKLLNKNFANSRLKVNSRLVKTKNNAKMSDDTNDSSTSDYVADEFIVNSNENHSKQNKRHNLTHSKKIPKSCRTNADCPKLNCDFSTGYCKP